MYWVTSSLKSGNVAWDTATSSATDTPSSSAGADASEEPNNPLIVSSKFNEPIKFSIVVDSTCNDGTLK